MEGREEFGIESCRFGGLYFGTSITRHSKIGILIDSTRDKAGQIFLPENVREGRGQAWSCLNCRIGSFTTIVSKLETENGFESTEIDVALDSHHIWVHVPHILGVQKDECLVRIIAQCDDVLYVVVGHTSEIIEFAFFPEVLLVVRYLDDHGHVECVHQVLVQDEG